mgnify:CR=1 FL=1
MKAFPSNHDPKTGTMNLGMELRDYLAARVVSGLVINYAIDLDDETVNGLAKTSYKLADALMRARDE